MGKLEALVKHGVLTFFKNALMKLAAPLRGWMSSGNHLRCDSRFVEDWMWYFGKRLSGHCFLPPESDHTFAIFLWYLVTLEVKVRWCSRFSFCFRRGSHKPSCATKNRSLASRGWSDVTTPLRLSCEGLSTSNNLVLCQN